VADKDKLVFLHDLPVGRTIVANYKYRPSFSGDRDQIGNAYRAKADFTTKRLSLTGEIVTKDSEFSPINAYNNMRDDQLTASMEFKASERIAIFSDYNTFKDSHDFDTDEEDKYEEVSGGITYKGNLFREVTYVRTEASHVDSATGTHFIDNTKEVDAISVMLNLMKDDKLIFDTVFEDTAFDDNTGRLSDREIEKRHYGVIINPNEKLGIETYYEMVDVASIAPSSFGAVANFGVTTYSRKMLINYYPNEIWALSGDMLLQARTDSRPDMKSNYQDSARISLAANPFGKFTYVNASLFRKDIPDESTGGTRTDMLGFDFGYKIASKWVMEPSFNKTLSKVADTSRS
ncbi:MAG: hypothetical protein KAG97_13145, partial [Victivallales bacterium]|nr:hypothetical protein [Victivallales bacterium]